MPKGTRACAECGEDFTSQDWRPKRCQDCRSAAPKACAYHHICELCSVPFMSRYKWQRFCSPKCANQATRPIVKRTCDVCDRDFVGRTTNVCSTRCRQWFAKHRGRKPLRSCRGCSAPIVGRQHDAKYCSERCAKRVSSARRGGRVPPVRHRWCQMCGAAIGESRKVGVRYCPGKKCLGRANQFRRYARRTGAAYERFSPLRIFERDNWTCHLCDGQVDKQVKGGPWSASLDHVIPVCDPQFPGHIVANVALAHLRCNMAKGGTATEHDWALHFALEILQQRDPIPLNAAAEPRTHCRNGHAYEGNSRHGRAGHRICLACDAASRRRESEKRTERRRAARTAANSLTCT